MYFVRCRTRGVKGDGCSYCDGIALEGRCEKCNKMTRFINWQGWTGRFETEEAAISHMERAFPAERYEHLDFALFKFTLKKTVNGVMFRKVREL